MKNTTNTASQRLRRICVIVIMDILCIVLSFFAALWFRYDFSIAAISNHYLHFFSVMIGPWTVLSLLVFYLFGLYRSIWSFVSIDELFRIILAYLCLGLCLILLMVVMPGQVPASYYILGILFSFFCTVGLRFSYRFLRYLYSDFLLRRGKSTKNVMIIGAGEAGRSLIREFAHTTIYFRRIHYERESYFSVFRRS